MEQELKQLRVGMTRTTARSCFPEYPKHTYTRSPNGWQATGRRPNDIFGLPDRARRVEQHYSLNIHSADEFTRSFGVFGPGLAGCFLFYNAYGRLVYFYSHSFS